MTSATTVADLLRARAAEAPDAIALRAGEGASLTYGEWDARADRAARGLKAQGVVPGDRVALGMGNDRVIDHAVCYIATLRAGAVAVPIGTRFAGPERAHILGHAGVSLVVESAAQLAEAAGAPGEPVDVARAPEDLAEIIYTSGTTGLPKGVACPHGNLMVHDLPAEAPGGSVSFLHAFPVGTQAAQEALRVPLRFTGRTAVTMAAFDADEACTLIERFRVTRVQLVPAMAELLAASGAVHEHDVSSVRRIVLSSAPAAPALFARLADAFPAASRWNAYALAEAGGARTIMRWDPERPSAVGYPVGETEVAIVDGEIRLRRPGAPCRSYYRDPEATAAVWVDGWVRTGDVGRLDPDGCLHLLDRAKDLVITGGANVSPVEVEHVLAAHPAVVEAAVVGVAHAVLGEDVAAAVAVRAPTPVRELQDWARARLAEHKVPHRMVLVDRLPRNRSGKVVKDEVRALFPPPAAGDGVSPRDAAEAVIASIWEAVLAAGPVGVEDDFFALGGHSLAAIQVASRVADAFGVELAVTAVFEHPTVAELAQAVAPLTASPAAP